MSSLADVVLDPNNIIAAVAAVAAFATIVTLAGPMFSGGRFESRVKSVTTERERLRRQSRANLDKNSRRSLRDDPRGMMRAIVEQLNLAKLLEDPALNSKLMQAGLRGQRPIFAFYFARLALPTVLSLGLMFYLFFVNDHEKSVLMRLCISLGAGVIGLYLPGLYLSNIASKRRDSIMKVFPDALDLLLICVEAGMSIEAAFQKVASEIGGSSIELAEELSLTTAELSFLQDRRMAYENLSKRTNHAGVKAVSTALIQAERYGTPLGNALRVMAQENRAMRLAAAEKKAASLPAKLTVPMIVFFLPVLFVVILGPAIIRFNELN